MRGDTLKGHLDLLLLAVLEDAPLHGYLVIERLRERSQEVFDLPEGTIYPALHRLERARFISSKWDEGNGRRRRIYSLTAGGKRHLEERREEWTGFARAVGSVVGQPT